ncbi:hypothetical protein PC116_g26420 [Phytophthora cactorum]|nr:hypothetical protein Pcac1_g20200 [Phytophthora cactorum]KAG4225137.1 hypothetical protein PC116_g26420 [Phytophthora cactorum]
MRASLTTIQRSPNPCSFKAWTKVSVRHTAALGTLLDARGLFVAMDFVSLMARSAADPMDARNSPDLEICA